MVLDSRDYEGTQRRIRLCVSCKRRFKTTEEVAEKWHKSNYNPGIPNWYVENIKREIDSTNFRKVRDYIEQT